MDLLSCYNCIFYPFGIKSEDITIQPEIFPVELVQIILLKSDFLEQIKLLQLCKYYQNHLKIYDFQNVNTKYRQNLTNEILKRYPYLVRLDASDNKNITDVNHLKYLKKLYANGEKCGIDDDAIKNLNLTTLYALDNPKITNPKDYMTNLKKFENGYRNRYFKLVYNGAASGRYTGDKPKQAAGKAYTAILKKLKEDSGNINDNNNTIKFGVMECTRGSNRKTYMFEGTRIELNQPMTISIPDGHGGTREFSYKYYNRIKKCTDN